RIHGHLVQPGIEAFGSTRSTGAVFGEEQIKETNLLNAIFDDIDSTVGDGTAVCEAGVAFETAVIENLDRFVHLEAGAPITLDVRPEMPARRGVVHAYHVGGEDVEKRDHVWPTIWPYGRDAPDMRG